jgi:hypothetical protein
MVEIPAAGRLRSRPRRHPVVRRAVPGGAAMTTLHDQWTALYTAGRVRWMAGMKVDQNGNRVLYVHPDGKRIGIAAAHGIGVGYMDAVALHLLPDFSDPATEGCLLHQAREAWSAVAVNAHVSRHHSLPGGEKWVITIGSQQPGIEQPTRIAAILAAIAAAPPKVNP